MLDVVSKGNHFWMCIVQLKRTNSFDSKHFFSCFVRARYKQASGRPSIQHFLCYRSRCDHCYGWNYNWYEPPASNGSDHWQHERCSRTACCTQVGAVQEVPGQSNAKTIGEFMPTSAADTHSSSVDV